MPTVSELMSQNNTNAMMNYRLWGNLVYVVSAYDIFPDGTDVTIKLQYLVNLAIATGRNTIFFPAGEYFVTSILNDDNIIYFGDNATFVGGYEKKINSFGDYISLEQQLDETTFYENIGISSSRDSVSATNYYVVVVPQRDENNNLIELKRGFSADNYSSHIPETVRSFSTRNNPTAIINASVFNMSTNSFYGVQIYNGVVITDDAHEWRWKLGIKPGNVLVAYDPSYNAASILADGCNNALMGFIPLIMGGASVSQTIIDSYASSNEAHSRQVIARKNNGDLIFFTCDSSTGSTGMTVGDTIRILLSRGDINFAFLLDGGGSTQTVVRNRLLNKMTDGSGLTERPVLDFLYVGKSAPIDPRNKQMATATQDIGELSKSVNDLSVGVFALGLFNRNVTNLTDINTILVSGIYWAVPSATGNPTGDSSYAVIHLNYDTTTALQIAFSFQTPSRLRVRRKVSSTWAAWGTVS